MTISRLLLSSEYVRSRISTVLRQHPRSRCTALQGLSVECDREDLFCAPGSIPFLSYFQPTTYCSQSYLFYKSNQYSRRRESQASAGLLSLRFHLRGGISPRQSPISRLATMQSLRKLWLSMDLSFWFKGRPGEYALGFRRILDKGAKVVITMKMPNSSPSPHFQLGAVCRKIEQEESFAQLIVLHNTRPESQLSLPWQPVAISRYCDILQGRTAAELLSIGIFDI